MKRVYKNLLSSILPQLVNIISNLILPGLIIAQFGSEINGLVSTTKTIVSYIALVGAGIATAVTQSLYAPVAKGDTEQIKGMLHAANNMFVKYGVAYCVITVLVAVVYPFCVSSNIEFLTIALLLVVMSLSGASEFFVIGRCRTLLYASQKVYICNIIQAVSLLVGLVVAVVMLKLNAGIVLVQLAISLVYVVRAAVLLRYVNRCYPELRDFPKTPAIAQTVSKRNDAMIHQLSGLAVTGSQSLILSVLVSLEAASIYAVYNIVFSGLQSICANINTAVTPYLGKEISLEHEEKARNIYDVIELGFVLLVAFVYSVATLMIVPFVRLYTAGADINYLYTDFAVLFAFSGMFYILKMPGTAAINAAGHFRQTRIRALAEAAICVVVSLVMTALVGQNGVLIGTLAALGWRCLDTVLYANKYILKTGNAKTMRRVLFCVLMVSVSALLAFRYDILASSYGQWVLIACGISILSVAGVVIYAVFAERKALSYVLRRLKK